MPACTGNVSAIGLLIKSISTDSVLFEPFFVLFSINSYFLNFFSFYSLFFTRMKFINATISKNE